MVASSPVPFRYASLYLEGQWKTIGKAFLQTALAVGKIALAILAYPFLYVFNLIYHCFYPTQAGQIPSREQSERALEIALLQQEIISNASLLKYSISTSFYFNEPQTADLYRGLIRTHGALEGQQPPINVYQWAAGCLISQALLAKANDYTLINYPQIHPLSHKPGEEGRPGIRHERAITELHALYSRIREPESQAAVLLQIMVPSLRWELNSSAKYLVDKVHARAQAMIHDPIFLNIFDTVAANI